jgi:hypothetical protein
MVKFLAHSQVVFTVVSLGSINKTATTGTEDGLYKRGNYS